MDGLRAVIVAKKALITDWRRAQGVLESKLEARSFLSPGTFALFVVLMKNIGKTSTH